MGTSGVKRLKPILFLNFKIDDKKQKNYCLNIIDNYHYTDSVEYIIKSSIDTKFSIKLKVEDTIYDIRTEFNDSKEDMKKVLEDIDESIFYDENSKEIKSKMLKKQKKLRGTKLNENLELPDKDVKNEKINEVLENMCIYGNITKTEIKKEKKKNPEKFIDTYEALKLEKEDPGLFALGLISQNLENLGITTAIDKSNQDDADEGLTALQYISNGMIGKKKYDLHFEFEKKRKNELLNNKKEKKKKKKKLKQKLSKSYNIPMDKIIVTLPKKGNFHVQVIFQSEEFNNLDINEFKNKFKYDPDFKELSNLKEIHTDVIMGGCKLKKSILDPEGNRSDGWGIGEKRGNKPYDPPLGWIGIGLKVTDKYGDKTWIGMNNSPGEWCVAYHGVGCGQTSNNVKKITGNIVTSNFKAGSGQAHKNCPDQYHPGKLVGTGVYCTPTIKTAGEQYAGISEINGVKYKTVLMVRVKPEAIRHCDQCFDSRAPYNYWVVNGTEDEIRPYRILYKKC